MLLALAATAAPIQPGLVTLAGVGNGQGWNDGHAYVGYVTLRLNGTDYTALCVDALHETAVVSAGIKQRNFRRFCSRPGWPPVAGTRYTLYTRF